MKKVVALFLSLLMVLTLLPTVAFADSTITLKASTNGKSLDNLVAGDIVTVTIGIPEFTTRNFSFDLNIDSSVFTYNNDTSLDVIKAAGFTLANMLQVEGTPDIVRLVAANLAGAAKIPAHELKVNFTVKQDVEKSAKFSLSTLNVDAGANVSLSTDAVSVKTVIIRPVTGVTLDKTSLSLAINNAAANSATLTATVKPDNATNKTVSWKTSDASVAAISGTGASVTVTAKKAGTATITVTTADGSYTAECKVTVVNCEHKNIVNHPAKAATCKAEGNIEYWECSDCHTKWSDEAHTKVVTKVSTDKVSHNFTKKDTSAAYLKSAANCHAKAVYYYSCTMCGVKGTTTFEYGTVSTTNHDGTLSYKHISGSDKHEVTCNGCHAKLREEACASTKTATCTKKAVCNLCHTEFGSLAKHTLTFVPEVKATCVKDGNVAYYHCSVCKQNFEDQAATKVLTKVTTEKAHSLEKVAAVAATCTKSGTKEHYKCTVCGKLFTDAAGKTETTIDKLTTTKAHDLEKVPEVAATCTTPGTKEHYKCKDCGKLFTDKNGKTETTADKLVIPAAHKLVKTGAIAATCTTTGNIEYWTCTVCNKHFSDKDGKNDLVLADATISALGHKLTKTEKKDATCTATGCEAYWTCSQCKGIFADDKGETATTLDKLTIAKKDHTPGDYVTNAAEHFKTCTVCGTEIKDSRAKHDFVKDEATDVETCKTCGYATGGTVGEDHQHTADTSKWLRDETNHWHKCTDANCTAHLDNEGHKFTTKSETVGKTTTTVSTCSVCGYVKRTETTSGGNTSGGSTTPAKDIQSGKTFDAGIALYVGLSLLSVTGGAIVIGKKKEF